MCKGVKYNLFSNKIFNRFFYFDYNDIENELKDRICIN